MKLIFCPLVVLPVFSAAANLEWLATGPANAGVLVGFLLQIFPHDHGGNHTPSPTTPQL